MYHDRGKNKTYIVKRRRAGVKDARLSFRLLYSFEDGCSLSAIRLFTGRTHQIRVQFASRGFPLCGDRKYGAKRGGKLALFSWKLSFPYQGQELSFCLPAAQLPP